jgi:ppGpp synthetase/RelA/SpoT-type nucleotidyltranferase
LPPVLPYEGIHLSDLEELSWWEKIGDRLKPYSNKQINNAGISLRDAEQWTDELGHAFDLIGEWRSSHAYPLRLAYTVLQRRAKRIDSLAVVSQRLKRIVAISKKLRRPENRNMKLSTMQDIGGCRAVVNTIQEVRQLTASYRAEPDYDYIQQPKLDGYRSLHLIERYEPRSEKHELYKGCRTEIQIRSRLQHAWATAVEAVDFIFEQKLKLGEGDDDWKRFFLLASSAIALQEGTPPIPNTPMDKQLLATELREISIKLNAFRLMSGAHLAAYSANRARKQLRKAGSSASAFLLFLDMHDPNRSETKVTAYPPERLAKANEDYITLEKELFGDYTRHAVLLSVGKNEDIKPAYPSFFLDTHRFVWTIEEFIKQNGQT